MSSSDDTQPPPPQAPPTSPSRNIERRRATWPLVLGIIAIVFGSIGLLGSIGSLGMLLLMPGIFSVGWGGAGSHPFSPENMFQIVTILGYFVAVPFAIWHLVSGIGLTQHRYTLGVKSFKLWAYTTIVYTLLVAPFAAFLSIQTQIAASQGQFSTSSAGAGATAAITSPSFVWTVGLFSTLLGIAVACAWPVFVLYWMNRSESKRDIATFR